MIEQRQSSWFVYLLPLADCSAFKVGFSCDPLTRIYPFSHPYYAPFAPRRPSLLALATNDAAREVEATLKAEFAAYRAEAPEWVPLDAGGHTEWFSAVYLQDAEARLCELAGVHDAAQLEETAMFIRAALDRAT